MKLADYRKIAPQVHADLKAALAKHGLELRPFGARVDERGGLVLMKLECVDANHKDETGAATTPERELFKSSARYVGLKAEWLDAEITLAGRRAFKVTGLKQRGKKCVMLKEVSTGKEYVTTPGEVLRHFALAGDADARKNMELYG